MLGLFAILEKSSYMEVKSTGLAKSLVLSSLIIVSKVFGVFATSEKGAE